MYHSPCFRASLSLLFFLSSSDLRVTNEGLGQLGQGTKKRREVREMRHPKTNKAPPSLSKKLSGSVRREEREWSWKLRRIWMRKLA